MRTTILGAPLDDYSLEEISRLVCRGSRVFQVFVNIHKLIMINNDAQLQGVISDNACICSADGKWIEWLARTRRFFPKQRFGGLDVLEHFFSCSQKQGLSIYLLGATQEILEKASSILMQKYPGAGLIGMHDGFFSDEAAVLADIRAKRPHVLFLALPSPRKELLGYTIFSNVESLAYVAGVGGAFDLIAGKTSRAPLWVQRMGMEWAYRCVLEPRRLLKRYIHDGFCLFLLLCRSMHEKKRGRL